MGVKVVLSTGVSKQDATAIAIATGILREEHKNICGAVVSGKDLRKIARG